MFRYRRLPIHADARRAQRIRRPLASYQVFGLLQIAVVVLDATGKFYDRDVAYLHCASGSFGSGKRILVEFDAEAGSLGNAHKSPLHRLAAAL